MRPSIPSPLNDNSLELIKLVDSADRSFETGSKILGTRMLGSAEEDERGEGRSRTERVEERGAGMAEEESEFGERAAVS